MYYRRRFGNVNLKRRCFIAGGTMIACVEAEGIDASGARVAASDIKRRRDRAVRHLLQETDSASSGEVFHFD
jgi:hypothetical protein